MPWSFSRLIHDKPVAALTVLIADSRLTGTFKLEAVTKVKEIRTVIVPNASHWIQYEFPEVIVEDLEALRTTGCKDSIVSILCPIKNQCLMYYYKNSNLNR